MYINWLSIKVLKPQMNILVVLLVPLVPLPSDPDVDDDNVVPGLGVGR